MEKRMTKDEALKLGLKALEGFIPYLPLKDEAQCNRYDKAIAAIKEALAQPTSGDYAFGYFETAQQAHDVYVKFLGETYGQFAQ